MAHLYFKAKESFAAQAPVEVRILKHLLSVDSPSDRAVLLDQAFQPGGLTAGCLPCAGLIRHLSLRGEGRSD